MKSEQVVFPLAPVYKRKGINFYQALATGIFPEGNNSNVNPFVEIKCTGKDKNGEGHAHIYIDDVKIGRVYGEWYHLATANLNLSPGSHVVRVDLN